MHFYYVPGKLLWYQFTSITIPQLMCIHQFSCLLSIYLTCVSYDSVHYNKGLYNKWERLKNIDRNVHLCSRFWKHANTYQYDKHRTEKLVQKSVNNCYETFKF